MPSLAWLLLVPVGVLATYALHRLCLWLEAKGHLYYLNKKPESSAANALGALERVLIPQSQHVVQVNDHKRLSKEADGAGPGAENSQDGMAEKPV